MKLWIMIGALAISGLGCSSTRSRPDATDESNRNDLSDEALADTGVDTNQPTDDAQSSVDDGVGTDSTGDEQGIQDASAEGGT